jgi:hypothetical protein
MDLICLDFESYFATGHSLTNMSPIEYVMHPDTEIISCAVKVNDYPTDVFFGEDEVRGALKSIDKKVRESLLVAHNMSGFDAMICAWRFGMQPKRWGCTLAMARPIHSLTVGNSLAKLVQHYGIGVKDNSALLNTKGRHLKDFTPDEIEAMKVYNRADTDQCKALFDILVQHTNPRELWLIDSTIRMLVNPQFVTNVPMLELALHRERVKKRKSLMALAEQLEIKYSDDDEATAAAVRAELMSAPKFSALLVSQGVEVPMKPSPSDPDSGKMVPALAKNDEEFLELQEHDNPLVAAATCARIEAKSTLLETRIESFITATNYCGGKLPIPIRYYGAHTGRDSGEQYNPQNLPRIGRDKEGNIVPKLTNALRMSLNAPPGYKVIVSDLSGIELRVNHFLWQVGSSMKLFRADPEKADLYKEFASKLYSVPLSEVSKTQRQVGKVAHLGLGFGAGAPTFRKVAKSMGGVTLNEVEAQSIVSAWRASYSEIVEGWATCNDALRFIEAGQPWPIDLNGLLKTDKDAIVLPSGRRIRYPKLRKQVIESGRNAGRDEWVFGEGRNLKRIYGGRVTENCIAEGTLVLTDAGYLPIEKLTSLHLIHDGVEFVRFKELSSKGVQAVIPIDGVFMTQDHEVLTDEGWIAASQSPRPYRPSIRNVNCAAPRHARTTWEGLLALPMRVWDTLHQSWGGRYQSRKAWTGAQLRMPQHGVHLHQEQYARYERAPSVLGISQHDRPLPFANAPSLAQLWRAWNTSVRELAARVSVFLGRYGRYLRTGFGFGPQGQRWPVLAGELPLGFPQAEFYEPSHHHQGGRCPAVKPPLRHREDHVVQPAESWLASGSTATEARLHKQVYDLINCGPRQRFVVLGVEGPFIVHNCVQALAADIIMDNSIAFWRQTKLRPALRVHDELVYIVPEKQAEEHLATLQQIMRTPPVWWPELVVWSEGDIADNYGAAK